MGRTPTAPLNGHTDPGPATIHDITWLAYSYFSWLMMLPFILPHEMSHALAAWAFNTPVHGAGLAHEPRFKWKGVRFSLVYSFFVLTGDAGSDRKNLAITLAPLAWFGLVPAFYGNTPLAVFVFIVGLTGISDVATTWLDIDGGVERGCHYWFVLGSPEHWQTTIERYA